ncbi:MAG: DUF2336 domain-containing protein [Rhodobiaceae bacterium]|nr:DUF2336 domain-containing protein [Rhodobiaceae bacterium]MCC0054678.1 DUF2336 domain-containing protein [Rhodobiaceae bacterium]
MFSAELQRLSHIVNEIESGRSDEGSLKILADLYARVHPLAPTLEMRFGAVVMALFARADETSRLYAAERLSEAAHLPAPLLRYLADAPIPFAIPVLEKSAHLDADQIAQAISSFDGPRMQAIARRNDITGDTIDLLIACGDRASVNILARNPAAFFDHDQTERLCARGDLLVPGAQRLLDLTPRGSLPAPGLFRYLDSAGRRTFLAALEEQPLKPAPALLVSDELRRHIAEGFVQLCRHGSDEAIAAIARLADIPRDIVQRGYEDAGGEMLAVLIRACDIGERALGAVLVLNEHLIGLTTERLRALTSLHNGLSLAAAHWLTSAWSGRDAAVEMPEAASVATVVEKLSGVSRQAIHDPAVARPGAERRGGTQGQPRVAQPGRERQGRKNAG